MVIVVVPEMPLKTCRHGLEPIFYNSDETKAHRPTGIVTGEEEKLFIFHFSDAIVLEKCLSGIGTRLVSVKRGERQLEHLEELCAYYPFPHL